ncbi:MAG: hypothetical protein K2X81_05015, partial [Candidatus Obscuribacterales bacterium]|nr:hypothetical protein [Candidatus Obscuribacterales bacterium]
MSNTSGRGFVAAVAGALLFCAPLSFFVLASAAEASTPRQLVTNSVGDLSSHTAQLVQQVQVFFQAAGQWPPTQGAGLQLCQALQSFQQSTAKLSSDNSSRPYSQVQTDYQQLQLQSQVLEQLLNQVAQNLLIAQAWALVRNDLVAINQALATSPGFSQNNFYDTELGLNQGMGNSSFSAGIPGGGFSPFGNGVPSNYPGFRPTNINITENSTFNPNPTFQGSYSNMPFGTPAMPGMTSGFRPVTGNNGLNNYSKQSASSNLSSAESQTERFVKQVTTFLQMKGKWMPPQGSPEMQLCQSLQSFQQQLRKIRADI